MPWIKKGLIYQPHLQLEWSQSHAQMPIAYVLNDKSKLRIYFSTRNKTSQSRPTFIDVSIDNPANIVYEHNSPILELGPPGSFDDCGIIPSWIIEIDNAVYMYYVGWNVRNTVPYYNSVGLAISHDGGTTFKKFSDGPLWDRNYREPYFSATTCVMNDNGLFRNWYLSCVGYIKYNNVLEPRYHLKYCESHNGIDWKREQRIAIDFKNELEAGIAKASVIKRNNKYYMWFCYRNLTNYRTDLKQSYRIGYAESADGVTWERKDDKAGIEPAKEGWDSEMICYPHVFEMHGNLHMLYNGNGFGKSGFGYATLKIIN